MDNTTYTVKKGDTLTGIAKKLNITTAKIQALNPPVMKNPNIIYPGMILKISDKPNIKENRISRLVFDGNFLYVHSVENNKMIYKFNAISGLPPKAPHLAELIKKGRKDLKIDTDYTNSKHQDVSEAGPIQEDDYTLKLKPNMPYDKSKAKGDGAGWGEGGWILTEHFWAKAGNYFGGRFGFFIHHDGGARGTSGCIGLKYANDMKKLKAILIKAYANEQKTVLVQVRYNNGK